MQTTWNTKEITNFIFIILIIRSIIDSIETQLKQSRSESFFYIHKLWLTFVYVTQLKMFVSFFLWNFFRKSSIMTFARIYFQFDRFDQTRSFKYWWNCVHWPLVKSIFLRVNETMLFKYEIQFWCLLLKIAFDLVKTVIKLI